jgi:phosphoribosylglycinamide formyltransferase-1
MNIAVFASGSGSNAQKIFDHFKNHPRIKVSVVLCNKPNAFVIERAKQENIPVLMVDKISFKDETYLLPSLKNFQVDFIVLAGFLWLIPDFLTKAFSNKMVNIHPALLPKYGGKGMHGHFVHEAVFENKEKESGITVHYVNEVYDSGEIIFQAKCNVEGLNPEEIAAAVLKLEHEHFPKVIDKLLS